MRKILLLFFVLLPLLSYADNVTLEKAQAIARKFFILNNETRTITGPSLRMIWDGEDHATRSTSAPAFYVFNNESGKGFVIVSGDDCTASPVLGYSFDENFSADNMPANLSIWMHGIRSEINEARSRNAVTSDAWAAYEHNDMNPIVKLETALWDQGAPYNSKLPLGKVTGCPATAISIIMRYHRWPDKGAGTIPAYDEVPSITLGHTYDWNSMPLKYSENANGYEAEQVGILMRDVGAMIRTQYGGGTAGANPEETLPYLMPLYMRYDRSTIKSLFKRDFTDNEWHAILQKELNEKRPILYGGYSSGGGHQFVLDGYAANNYYHVNWGWSGVSNGYYLLTGMNPPQQGTGGSSSADGFTKKQDAIIGIQPDYNNPGGVPFDLILLKGYRDKPYGLTSDAVSFAQGTEFNVTITELQNKGSRDFKGSIAIGHYSADGAFKGTISNIINLNKYPLHINEFTNPTLACVISQPIEDGDYIAGVFKYIDPSDWTMIRNSQPAREDCTERIMLKGGGGTPIPPASSHKLTISVGSGGRAVYNGQTIRGISVTEMKHNSNAVVNITPDEGFEISSVKFNNNDVTAIVSNGRYVTPAITSDSKLDITFAKIKIKHDLDITVSEGGMVRCGGQSYTSAATVKIVDGRQLELEIVPYTGYDIESVVFNGRNITSSVYNGHVTTPAITAHSTIAVKFCKTGHDLTLTVGEGGRVVYNGTDYTGSTVIAGVHDKPMSFSIVPDNEHIIDAVIFNGNDVSYAVQDGIYSTPAITQDSKLEVRFRKAASYNVAFTMSGIGQLRINGNVYMYHAIISVKEKEEIVFDLISGNGYVTDHVIFNGKELAAAAGSRYVTPAITSNSRIEIKFMQDTNAGNIVTLDVRGSGKVVYDNTECRNHTQIKTKPNQRLLLNIVPDRGYKLRSVLMNGSDITSLVDADGRLLTYPLQNSCTFVIMFEPKYQDIDINIGKGGSIVLDNSTYTGSVTARAVNGSKKQIEIIEDSGYEIESLLFNGTNVTSEIVNGVYTTPALTSHSKIDITFRVVTGYDLKINVGQDGKVICYGTEITDGAVIKADDGEQVKIKVVPDKGFNLSSITYNYFNNVTDQIKDGFYTTPAITGNTFLSFSFTKTGDIGCADSGDLKVYGRNGMITVEGADPSRPVDIYNLDGTKASSTYVTSSSVVRIAVCPGNTYIVCVSGKKFKIAL